MGYETDECAEWGKAFLMRLKSSRLEVLPGRFNGSIKISDGSHIMPWPFKAFEDLEWHHFKRPLLWSHGWHNISQSRTVQQKVRKMGHDVSIGQMPIHRPYEAQDQLKGFHIKVMTQPSKSLDLYPEHPQTKTSKSNERASQQNIVRIRSALWEEDFSLWWKTKGAQQRGGAALRAHQNSIIWSSFSVTTLTSCSISYINYIIQNTFLPRYIFYSINTKYVMYRYIL